MGLSGAHQRCPLYPSEQTLLGVGIEVRYVPIADIQPFIEAVNQRQESLGWCVRGRRFGWNHLLEEVRFDRDLTSKGSAISGDQQR